MIVARIVLLVFLCAVVVFLSLGWTNVHILHKAKPGQKRIACVGDSITYGCGIFFWPKDQYPAKLQQILGKSYCVNNYGFNGRTLQSTGDHPYVKEKVYQQSLDDCPDIVIIMLGANDAKTLNWIDKESYKAAYTALLDSYRALSSQPKIYICTPTMIYYSDEAKIKVAKTMEIPFVNLQMEVEAVHELADEQGLTLIDLHTLTTGHRDWFVEGLHPNATGASQIAEKISQSLLE